MDRCKHCLYFAKFKIEDDDTNGECRKHAPLFKGRKADAVWPIVSSGYWCGDYYFNTARYRPELQNDDR